MVDTGSRNWSHWERAAFECWEGGSALAPLVLQPQGTAQGHGGRRGCLVQAAELLLLRVTWLIMCVTWGLLAVTCPEWVRTGRCRWR